MVKSDLVLLIEQFEKKLEDALLENKRLKIKVNRLLKKKQKRVKSSRRKFSAK
jgi:hypothetical protein